MKTTRTLTAVRKPLIPSFIIRRAFSSHATFRPIVEVDHEASSRLPQSIPLSSRQISRIGPHVPKSSFHTSAQTPTITKSPEPTIHPINEPTTGTWQYLIADPSSLHAIIIDPVLNYDSSTQTISTSTADAILSIITSYGYTISKILETHAHADHLTAAAYLQHRLEQMQGFRPPIGIGRRITTVQRMFGERYGVPEEEWKGAFEELFEDGEEFAVGNVRVEVVHLPGHTPDHVGYVIGDNVFCGDSLFHADIGTARCDFPGGSASDMYHSVRKLVQLPDHFKIWTGHDYVSKEREEPSAWLSVREHKERNKWLAQDVTLEQFVERRSAKDKGLAEPRLLHPSLQVNIRAGRLPSSIGVGLPLLHLPLKVEGEAWSNV